MERTREETARRALRLIGVCASDEPPSDDQMAGALLTLDSIFAELREEAQPTWDVSTGVPSEAFIPLANWLGAELAGEYAVSAPMTRARAKLRVLAVVRPAERCCDETDPCADYGMGAKVVYVGGIPGANWDDEGTW